jgi:hypothetical protein
MSVRGIEYQIKKRIMDNEEGSIAHKTLTWVQAEHASQPAVRVQQ